MRLEINSSALKINILFVINPISGGKNKQQIPAIINTWLDSSKFDPVYRFTDYVGHAAEITGEAMTKAYKVIVAVGGDGTVNEVAGKLIHSETLLGIIPLGSGNGLARTLGIPLNLKKAIRLINALHPVRIDGARLNDKHFFNISGMGFDAAVSAGFGVNKVRGLKGYVSLWLKKVIHYKPDTYQVTVDGTSYQREAFLMSVANSSQFGNDVIISPQSRLNDGLLEVVIIKPLPVYKLPLMVYSIWRAKKKPSDWVEIIRGKHIVIDRLKDTQIHLDGEPVVMGKHMEIDILENALQVIAV